MVYDIIMDENLAYLFSKLLSWIMFEGFAKTLSEKWLYDTQVENVVSKQGKALDNLKSESALVYTYNALI